MLLAVDMTTERTRKSGLLARWLGLAMGALAVPAAAAEGPHIPEPMVFDLVRGLGARPGELEVNTLAHSSLRGGRQPEVTWAPEVEWAFAPGHAVELEFPLHNTSLEAVKLALQGTVGTGASGRFIHGWQAIGEMGVGRHARTLQGSALWLAGWRFDERWSVFGMTGARLSRDLVSPARESPMLEGLLNVSGFADLSPSVTLGLETNWAVARRDGLAALFMPQVHLGLMSHLRMQLGAGAQLHRGDLDPRLALRFIAEM